MEENKEEIMDLEVIDLNEDDEEESGSDHGTLITLGLGALGGIILTKAVGFGVNKAKGAIAKHKAKKWAKKVTPEPVEVAEEDDDEEETSSKPKLVEPEAKEEK